MTADSSRKITREINEAKWEALKRVWKNESRPGQIILPKESYEVHVIDDVVEFWPIIKDNSYESRSL